MKALMLHERRWLGPSALLVLAAVLTACSYQSVRHLDRQPWAVGEKRSLAMNYLRFDYLTALDAEGIRILGTAYPRNSAIPSWASWAQDIWLATYLCNDKGRVLAKKIAVLQPQALSSTKGFDFDFLLEPRVMAGSSPVFVTFGYRLMLTTERGALPQDFEPSSAEAKDVFFASESALTRF